MFLCTKNEKPPLAGDGLREFQSVLSSRSGSEILPTGVTNSDVSASNSTNKRQPLQQQFLDK
jgi:hypothetical protein